MKSISIKSQAVCLEDSKQAAFILLCPFREREALKEMNQVETLCSLVNASEILLELY